jgi:hypothetical protein
MMQKYIYPDYENGGSVIVRQMMKWICCLKIYFQKYQMSIFANLTPVPLPLGVEIERDQR